MELWIIGVICVICIAGILFLQFLFWENTVLKRKEEILRRCKGYYRTCARSLPAMAETLAGLDEILSGTLDPEETEAHLLLEQMDRGKRQLVAEDSCLVALLTEYYESCMEDQLELRWKLTIPSLFQKEPVDAVLLYDCLLQLACGWAAGAPGCIKIREAEKYGIWHLELKVTVMRPVQEEKRDRRSAGGHFRAGRQLKKSIKWFLRRYHLKWRMKKTENQLEIDIIT